MIKGRIWKRRPRHQAYAEPNNPSGDILGRLMQFWNLHWNMGSAICFRINVTWRKSIIVSPFAFEMFNKWPNPRLKLTSKAPSRIVITGFGVSQYNRRSRGQSLGAA
jgi:hypothetical protein